MELTLDYVDVRELLGADAAEDVDVPGYRIDAAGVFILDPHLCADHLEIDELLALAGVDRQAYRELQKAVIKEEHERKAKVGPIKPIVLTLDQQRAIIMGTFDYTAPIVAFPCAWELFAAFINESGFKGYIDAAVAVEWVLRRCATLQPGPSIASAMRADAVENNNFAVGLLTLALAKAKDGELVRNERGRQVANLAGVQRVLVGLAEAEGLDMKGIGPTSLEDRLRDGAKELNERRPKS